MVGEVRRLETKGLLVLHCMHLFFFFVLGGLRPSFDVNDNCSPSLLLLSSLSSLVNTTFSGYHDKPGTLTSSRFDQTLYCYRY
jgi:hypothetical protein